MSEVEITTIGNQKGGAGKTSITILTALALERAGKQIAIVDIDPQQTASRAIAHLQEIKRTKIAILKHARSKSDFQGSDFDYIFVDTPPALGEQLRWAISISDRIILVSSPSPSDLWSSQESVEFIKKHRRKGTPTRVLFNSVVKKSKTARDLPSLAQSIGFLPLQNMITRRQAYQYAILQGWMALKPAERTEILKLAIEITTLK